MMKSIKCVLSILVLSLLATACSQQNLAGIDPAASNESQPPAACWMPLYFDNEEQFLRTLDEVYGKQSAEDGVDGVVYIQSDRSGEQVYNAKSDEYELSSLTEFYRPKDIPDGMLLKSITVERGYVAYEFVNEDQISSASFTWFREMSPEVAMNGLYGRGAISERETVYNGTKYVFLEWLDPEINESAGFSIHWVDSGIAYQAYIESGYSDEEMLEFCQFETVSVK
jgi:hypothetical protein